MEKSISREIVAHDFEKKKQQLREFANDSPKYEDFPIVDGGYHWYGVSVKATGDDLNKLSQRIGDSLIKQNKNIVDIRKEFISIYDTFEALDKNYIQDILENLAAADEANRKAFKALEGVERNNRQIEKDQIDLKSIIEAQKTSVKALLGFKERLDKIDHILDVDELFADVDRIRNELLSFQKEIEKSNKETKEFVNQLYSQLESTTENIQLFLQDKIRSVITNQDSKNSDTRELIRKNYQESNEIFNVLSQKVAMTDDEMKSVNHSISTLTQKLKITRVSTAGSFVFIIILIILIISGVL